MKAVTRVQRQRDLVPVLIGACFIAAISVTLLRSYFMPNVAEQMRDSDPMVRKQLYDLIQPVALANCRLERFGEPHDGGYLMCGNLLDSVESGYSYGISGYDGWGCDIASRLRIPVHQYDCFDTTRPSCPGGKTLFHAECVSDVTKTDEGRPFDTIENQLAKNGDEARRLVVKMDVEGAEWDSLRHASDATLSRIDQLSIEFHYINEDRFVAVLRRLKKFFYIAHLHFNNFSCADGLDPFPGWAYEVLLVSKRIGVVDETQVATLPHPNDAPNSPVIPDCQTPKQ